MIHYENFSETYASTVRKVVDFLGIQHDSVTLDEPRLQRQADDRSQEWEQRFLEMRKTSAGVAAHRSAMAASRTIESDASSEQKTSPSKHQAPRPKRPKRTSRQETDPPLQMTAFAVGPQPPRIATAEPHRDWMDATTKRFAYRCLPMVMANQAGWMILNRDKLAVTWSGGVDQDALKIDFLSGKNPRQAISLFGSGILTFLIGYLFRTPPGYNLHVRGPANSPKDAICALEGIVETDWPESTFTMNWKMTRANHPVVFEEGEPIAMLTPMPRHQLERFQPEIRNISENPELEARYREWMSSRQQHNREIHVPNSKAQKEGWQRHYMRGTTIRSEPAQDHQTSLALNNFNDRRA